MIDDFEALLVEAWRNMARLPDRERAMLLSGQRSCWPDVVRDRWQDYADTEAQPRRTLARREVELLEALFIAEGCVFDRMAEQLLEEAQRDAEAWRERWLRRFEGLCSVSHFGPGSLRERWSGQRRVWLLGLCPPVCLSGSTYEWRRRVIALAKRQARGEVLNVQGEAEWFAEQAAVGFEAVKRDRIKLVGIVLRLKAWPERRGFRWERVWEAMGGKASGATTDTLRARFDTQLRRMAFAWEQRQAMGRAA